jgi:hypothetical protein
MLNEMQVFKTNETEKIGGTITIELLKDGKVIERQIKHNAASDITRSIGTYLYAISSIYRLYLGSSMIEPILRGISDYSLPLSYSNVLYLASIVNSAMMELINSSETSVVTNKLFSKYTRIGYSYLSSTYSGSSSFRGSINASESNVSIVDTSHIKIHIVVDFPTSAANGTITAIQLLPYISWSALLENTLTDSSIYLNQSMLNTFGLSNIPTQGYLDTQVAIPALAISDWYYGGQDRAFFLSQDNMSLWVSFEPSYNGQYFVYKTNLQQQGNTVEKHPVYYADGTTVFTKPVYLETSQYLIGWENYNNSVFRVWKVDKNTWNADATNSSTFSTTIPWSTFAVNGLVFNLTSMGCCSATQEIYLFGYSSETINGTTVYHYRLFILDVNFSIKHTVELGNSTYSLSDYGVFRTKDFYEVIINHSSGSSTAILALIKCSDYSLYSMALVYGGIPYYDGSNSRTDCIFGSTTTRYNGCVLSHNIDDNLRIFCALSSSSSSSQYHSGSFNIVYPFTFLNKVVLDNPVTKTGLNTMKVQYDFTLDIPNPTVTL